MCPSIDTVDHKSIIVKLSSTFAPSVGKIVGCIWSRAAGANSKSLECEACKRRLALMHCVARGDLFTDSDTNGL